MYTGIPTNKTNWGVLFNYVDKKQNGDKKCRNETKIRKLLQTQQTNK